MDPFFVHHKTSHQSTLGFNFAATYSAATGPLSSKRRKLGDVAGCFTSCRGIQSTFCNACNNVALGSAARVSEQTANVAYD